MATKSRAQLQEEYDDLRRQVALLQANCQALSSSNQALLDFCYSDQLDTSSTNDAFAPPLDCVWPSNTVPITHSRASNLDFIPECTSNAYDCMLSATEFAASHQSWSNQVPLSQRYSQSINYHKLDFAVQDEPEQPCAGFDKEGQALCDYTSVFGDSIGSTRANSIGSPPIPLTTLFDEWNVYESANIVHARLQPDECPSRIAGLGNDGISRSGVNSSAFIRDESARPTTDDELLTSTPGNDGRKQIEEPPSCPKAAMLPPLRPVQLFPTMTSGFNMGVSRGALDDYITSLGKVLKLFETNNELTPELRKKVSNEGVLWIVREAWPQAEHFWRMTASFEGFLQSELWRNFPGRATYKSMHMAYRPTPTQLCTPHSPMIDWLPWPDLRDKIIEHQDQIDVDLVCKVAIQNVVAHRRMPRSRKRPRERDETTEVNGSAFSNKMASFRVWDLCLLEQKAGSRLPKSTELVFRPQSASVQALVKAYGLECDNFHTQKLHPQFFDVFPTLFVDSAISDYVVREMPALQTYVERDMIGSPREISPNAVVKLKEAIARVVRGSM